MQKVIGMPQSRTSSLLTRSLAVSLMCALSGCADPYKKEVPATYFTPGEAEQIAEQLLPTDKDVFLRWSNRVRTNYRYPGEVAPLDVRGAILSQQTFDTYDAERRRQMAIQNAEIAKRQQQEDDRFEREERKYKANEEISKILTVGLKNYRKKPIWAVTGNQIGWNWVFTLRLQNKGNKAVVAIKGTMELSDMFQKHSNSLAGQVDIHVPSGKSIETDVTYPHNDDSPLHNLMMRGQQIRYVWITDSIAFEDGTKFDYMSAGPLKE